MSTADYKTMTTAEIATTSSSSSRARAASSTRLLPHPGGPVAAARERRHEPVQEMQGTKTMKEIENDLLQKCLAQRHRQHRRRAPPVAQFFPEQLQLRRLHQGRRHRLGVGVHHEPRPPGPQDACHDGLQGRRRGRRAVLPRRRVRPHQPPGRGGQLLGCRPDRPLRPARDATSTRSPEFEAAGDDGDRYLEFWNLVFAVRPPGGRLHAGSTSAPQHRHGHGPRAHGRHHATQGLELRGRRLGLLIELGERLSGKVPRQLKEPQDKACASWPTTPAPSVADGDGIASTRPRLRAAALLAAPSTTAACSASRAPSSPSTLTRSSASWASTTPRS